MRNGQHGLYISKVAILGSGVMGAQLAAHMANCGIMTYLFDLPSSSQSLSINHLIDAAISNLKVLTPAPLASASRLEYIKAVNYRDHLEVLRGCDLVIEAIAEKIEFKEDLYQKIAPMLNEHTIIASNTSGLSIEHLSNYLPEHLRSRFCGIHFFNPPRYMLLVEVIPNSLTNKQVLEDVESFLVKSLGKNVIIAKDTPNFIANRIGVFSMLAACIYTEKFGIPLEVVDELTGKRLGRAKSATFRTADVVGLDTFAHVVETMQKNCKDGFEVFYNLPSWVQQLISQGALGQKVKAGFYRKDKEQGLMVIDLHQKGYRKADKRANDEVIQILQESDWAVRLEKLRASSLDEAKFLWACFRDLFYYACLILGDIANTVREVDMALRFGFGWKEGLFEIWQKGGLVKIANWIKEDIEAQKTVVSIPLPQWVFALGEEFYKDNLHYSIVEKRLVARCELPVYKRQLFPELLLNERSDVSIKVIYENTGVKLWHTGDDIGILSFKSKMCAIGMDVLQGIEEALAIAEEQCIALVIWQEKNIFSVGANLEEFSFAIMMNGAKAVDNIIDTGHRIVANRLRCSKIPVVAAVRGYVLGGGCEIMLHCDAVVAALESYIGLVEAGVGLLPGWGGSTEMAYRTSFALDPWKDFENRYKNLALAKVALSAYEAREMGFLREADSIVINSNEVLLVAKEKAKLMALQGYCPPINDKFAVFGMQGIANVKGLLANMYYGGQISEHDNLIAQNLAHVMCGGDIEKGSVVTRNWMLNIEKAKFKELALTQKTADRIEYMLTKGKPLRN